MITKGNKRSVEYLHILTHPPDITWFTYARETPLQLVGNQGKVLHRIRFLWTLMAALFPIVVAAFGDRQSYDRPDPEVVVVSLCVRYT
jgi:hypothetical protein